MSRNRGDAQPAFVLHSYPFRETSLIIEVFSKNYGRLALVARGARRPRSALRGVLQAFQPLELSWAGKGEVPTLMKAEWQGGQALLTGKALLCAYYLNELLMHLLPREDAHERLFAIYAATLKNFSEQLREADLRSFERDFLQELGYGLQLETDTAGKSIEPDVNYRYAIEHGPIRLESSDALFSVRGKTLLDIAGDDFSDPRSVQEAKHLMRTLITHHIGGKPLETRKIFRELQA